MFYRVTLVQRVKVEVEADSSEEALRAAQAQAQQEHPVFEPQDWSIKEMKV